MRLEELRLTLLLLLELDGRLELLLTAEREELLLLERFRLSERPALLRLGATERLEEVDGREISLLLLLELRATLLLRLLAALLVLVVGRFISRLRLSTPLVLFKLSERPLEVRALAVLLRFGVAERFTDELRLLLFDVTAVPRRVLLLFLL